jgi:hypothetical protein
LPLQEKNRLEEEANLEQAKKDKQERKRQRWIRKNLRNKSPRAQADLLEFIAIPPTLPPRVRLVPWQTDHMFESAEAIHKVVRGLNPTFAAVARQ